MRRGDSSTVAAMTNKNRFVVVSGTVAGRPEAEELARGIVEARLAACVQCEPVRSVYRWKGAVEEAAEVRFAAKTRASLAPKLVRFIRDRHAYEVPEIVVTPILGGHGPYLKWLEEETRPAPRRR
jgi:periplasmic divalent cation tolerance protein